MSFESKFSEDMPTSHEVTSVHDPLIQIPLSELSRLYADAEYYADLVSQYVNIRNKLVIERKELLDQNYVLSEENKSLKCTQNFRDMLRSD